jgi:hypothetical protein
VRLSRWRGSNGLSKVDMAARSLARAGGYSPAAAGEFATDVPIGGAERAANRGFGAGAARKNHT